MKYVKFVILPIMILLVSCNIFSNKVTIHKVNPLHKPKIHPYSHLLQSQATITNNPKRGADNNRLLVILIDFQEETTDDPYTTGNGKFLLNADPAYQTTIAAPPHNRDYYESNLEALRYYYQAASQGTFNLQYDIWPKNQTAYTLPHEMGYYNPAGVGSDLFLSRMEEYFKESFELADVTDSAIDFSEYGHFMIIHAGSDWQHDVFGDTPSDLPSFYIKVAQGKEAIVDNGHIMISQACNVPSTISQDFDSYESGGITYYTGYGALNGVITHEFGHSMGLVDLYNTYNSAPMVGQFDIMDSGGSGVTEDSAAPGVLVEGILPALPGAFSREIMFGELFKSIGLMLEVSPAINLSGLSASFTISASSQKQTAGSITPNLYKIPLNEHEYILIENRSVDPDGDGGTTIKGTPDGRVILYPTPANDPDDTPTYEYDYLLPSFVDAQYNAVGGGLLVWHVDEKRLYLEGKTDSDGVFVSNFERNTINYSHSHRGVCVIEADGLDDLGNDYSWFWTGTPYEYFHKFKPVLDQSGQFVNWSTQEWRPTLDAESTPALIDYSGQPSFFGIQEISQPMAQMSFRLSAGIFDGMTSLSESDTLLNPFPVINSNLSANVLPVMKGNQLHFYFYDTLMGFNQWSEVINPLDIPFSKVTFEPVTTDINDNGFKEIVAGNANILSIVELGNDNPELHSYNFTEGDTILTSPLSAFGKLWVATQSGLYKFAGIEDVNPIQADVSGLVYRLAADESHLVLQQADKLLVIDPVSYQVVESYSIAGNCTKYEPLIVKSAESDIHPIYYLVIDDNGNIYNCHNGIVTCIYHNNDEQSIPTNLALGKIGEYSPIIVFGLAKYVYAISLDGTLLPGYPHYYESYYFKPYSQIAIKQEFNRETPSGLLSMYFTLSNGGMVAITSDGNANSFGSIISMNTNARNQTFWDNDNRRLYWFFNIYPSSLVVGMLNDLPAQPFIWSGYRNGQNGFSEQVFSQPGAASMDVKVYAFPNPSKDAWTNLRVENPHGKIAMQIFDITGKELIKGSYSSVGNTYKDIYLDLSKFSSGVYIAVVKCDGQTKRCKFAVEK